MLSTNHFDYVIIGNGLAGLQLALEFSNDAFFDEKQFLLIDQSNKETNDKTWCFWEKGRGKWDVLVYKTWYTALFYSSNKSLQIPLHPYLYKMVRSLDFYRDAKTQLSQKGNFHFSIDKIIKVEETDVATITTNSNCYTAHHVFDSRIAPDFFNKNDRYTKINQHFKGWIIETDQEIFNPDTFTMMDYRLKDGNQTTFMYVLPFSATKALVEFTYFTPQLVDETRYEVFIKDYIPNILKIESYKVLEVEAGIIPMTNFPFEKYSTENLTKIGTAGGWAKGSTGYSFKHTEKKVAKIIKNIKLGQPPIMGLYSKKHRFYDAVFLHVLQDENHKGEWIFEKFYTKNQTETILRFLDEETSFLEDLQIMRALFSVSFIKAFFKTLLGQ